MFNKKLKSNDTLKIILAHDFLMVVVKKLSKGPNVVLSGICKHYPKCNNNQRV